ncbi:MAG: diaminopimelate epimerase [Pseudomonadota bacterium]
MELPFTKMHGLGNDFVVIDGTSARVDINAAQARAIADRRTGVGCDQLLFLESPSIEGADFDYRILNADGGEVEHCGNGARCIAVFARDQGHTDKPAITVNSLAGLLDLTIDVDDLVTVAMGIPTFLPAEIPFIAESQDIRYEVAIDDESYEFGTVAIGNPHAVTDVDDVDTAPVERIGAALQSHARFPNRVNVGFRQILNRDHIRLRVFERGVGETLACGTGACAAAITGMIQDVLNYRVTVSLPGGDLVVHWRGENQAVMMTGPAQTVYRGSVNLDDLA